MGPSPVAKRPYGFSFPPVRGVFSLGGRKVDRGPRTLLGAFGRWISLSEKNSYYCFFSVRYLFWRRTPSFSTGIPFPGAGDPPRTNRSSASWPEFFLFRNVFLSHVAKFFPMGPPFLQKENPLTHVFKCFRLFFQCGDFFYLFSLEIFPLFLNSFRMVPFFLFRTASLCPPP